jgi:hypothetical protein
MANRIIGQTTKREKMEPGEIGEQQWKREGHEIIHQVPGRGGEKREPQDGDGSKTRMSKRNVVEQRWKGREARTRETHERPKRNADGERSQDTPLGCGFAHW